jgi:hypothetical protein
LVVVKKIRRNGKEGYIPRGIERKDPVPFPFLFHSFLPNQPIPQSIQQAKKNVEDEARSLM